MEIDEQIRAGLMRYVRQETTLEEFEAWLTPLVWDLEASTDPLAESLASRLLLRLAEFSNGDLTEEELRADFRPLVQSQRESSISFAGATSELIREVALGAGSFAVGRSLAGASG